MNRRISFLAVVLALGGILNVHGAFSQVTIQPTKKAINLPDKPAQLPFSDAILSGNTLYLAGRLGLDPKTGKAPEQIEDEIKNLLDGELSLFEKFNPIYKSYFTTKDLPAREFIGAGSLLRGGHFELQAIAVKRSN
jgi:2-iminobutanoate/2-iminopropanoate deaminase